MITNNNKHNNDNNNNNNNNNNNKDILLDVLLCSSLSIFTSCAVFLRALRVNQNTNNEIYYPTRQIVFFVTSIQFVARALCENLSNRSSGVKYRVIFVLVLGVICTLQSAVG